MDVVTQAGEDNEHTPDGDPAARPAGGSAHESGVPARRTHPPFMTLAMRLAWLLRDDVRAGACLDDEAAQRHFVTWWLIAGNSDYAAAWWYGPVQATLAMTPVGAGAAPEMPALLRRLHDTRGDLGAAFPLDEADGVAAFYCWYRLFGPAELAAAPALPPSAEAATEQPAAHPPWQEFGIAIPRIAATMHAASAELQAAFDVTLATGQRDFVAWFQAIGRRTIPLPHPLPCRAEICPCPALRPPPPQARDGVNLVGFARAEFGIGEDVRALSAALDTADLDHVVIDIPTGPKARRQDDALDRRIADRLRFPLTIFCLTAFDTARVFLEHGPALFGARINIGSWAWELPTFPVAWSAAYDLVDEVWAASGFTQAAFAATCPKPVILMPPAVRVPPLPHLQRQTLGVPSRPAFVFIYPFDPNSYLTRKNPLAAVQAFQQAFGPDDRSVALLLRVNGTTSGLRHWPSVAAAIGTDDRIVMMEGTLDRATALAVLASCDCLVSPHRAEGFGRNIAEAILLGVPVLATGFSGCMDFLRPDETIAWSRQDVAPGDYPAGNGLWWADPSVADLAAKMRALKQDAGGRTDADARAAAMLASHGLEPAGRRYAERVHALLVDCY